MSTAAPAPLLLDAERLTSALSRIAARIGARHVVTAPSDLAPHLVEPRGLFKGSTPALVLPGSTDEVAFVVKTCAEAGLPMVPQGGNTGLVGGQVPFGAVLIGLSRLDKIRDLDATDHTVTVEAGVPLARVQEAALAQGCLFPLSIASEGSCQIGGNLSTNAGGTAVLRYGNARELTLGIEAVLPDGRVLNALSRLRKNNTGYDLKDVFIGAEGTLGIITAAVLKLFPAPRQRATAFCGLRDPHAALALFRRLRMEAGESLTGFEIVPEFGLEIVIRHMAGNRRPLAGTHPFYVLAELTAPRAGSNLSALMEQALADALEAGEIEDAVVAGSEQQADALWKLREDLSDAQKFEGGSIKHDVSVPVSRVADFMVAATRLCEREMAGLRVCAFGHIGDGNIHFNLSQPVGMDKALYLAAWERFNRLVHDLVVEMGGSFSAEHGIGLIKREEMIHYKDPVALDVMVAIKGALDPKGLMNPGKVLVPRP